jgi:hypothetical protein
MKNLESAPFASVLLLSLGCITYSAQKSGSQRHPSKHPFVHVDAIFREHCVSCHNDARRAEGLSLTSFGAMLRGGEHGPEAAPNAIPHDAALQDGDLYGARLDQGRRSSLAKGYSFCRSSRASNNSLGAPFAWAFSSLTNSYSLAASTAPAGGARR